MKPAKRVVRIEHYSCKTGFWNCKYPLLGERKRICNHHSKYQDVYQRQKTGNGFPPFTYDYVLNAQINEYAVEMYKFAFHTVDQLKEAFTVEELKEAIECLGFRVVVLTVTDYYESEYQIIFRNPISTEDISSQFAEL